MAATPTQAGIVNQALAMLGSTARIQSIDDDKPVARHAKAAWDLQVRELLADHPWNFALARVLLNAAGEVPAFGYDRQFALPADCLRWLPPSVDEAEWFDAVQEGDALLTNEAAPLPVRYISLAQGEQVARWPAHFAMAMAARMALALAEPVTQSESVDGKAEERANAAIRRAKRIDALASGAKQRLSVSRRSRWLQAARQPFNPNS